MVSGPLPIERTFDLRPLSAGLDPFCHRRRRALSAGIAGLAGFAIVLLAVSFGPLSDHSVSTFLASGLIGLLFIAVGGALVLAQWRRHFGPGALEISVGPTAFTLAYPRRSVTKSWNAPDLRFELGDATQLDPAQRTTVAVHSIEVDGDISLLSEAAFAAMLERVRELGLTVRTVAGPNWALSPNDDVKTHHIRPAPPLPSSSTTPLA